MDAKLPDPPADGSASLDPFSPTVEYETTLAVGIQGRTEPLPTKQSVARHVVAVPVTSLIVGMARFWARPPLGLLTRGC